MQSQRALGKATCHSSDHSSHPNSTFFCVLLHSIALSDWLSLIQRDDNTSFISSFFLFLCTFFSSLDCLLLCLQTIWTTQIKMFIAACAFIYNKVCVEITQLSFLTLKFYSYRNLSWNNKILTWKVINIFMTSSLSSHVRMTTNMFTNTSVFKMSSNDSSWKKNLIVLRV